MSGFGMSEIIVIVGLVLIFFGSKEVPRFVRELARIFARIRNYSEQVRREMDEMVRSTGQPTSGAIQSTHNAEQKKQIRSRFLAERKALGKDACEEKSRSIAEHLAQTPEYEKARGVLLYVATPTEVQTQELIQRMLDAGKRIAVPYCTGFGSELGIAEVRDFATELTIGRHGVLEPREDIRDNFFKSDLQLAIVPGVAFDLYGGRLGRGKGCYDTFLKDLKGRIPIFGLAYQCQILSEALPFDYHDVAVDQVITETGLLFTSEEDDAE
jgi:5-formyltetrahydrofolate cyclo-ligase